MITLWPISIEDTGFMLDLVHDPEATKYVPGLIRKEDEMRAWIEGIQPEDHEFIVLADGVPIGECSLTVYGCSGEVGFMLLPQYWRHGYGTEMLRQLLNLAEELGLEEVLATTDQDNQAAMHLLTKAGFECQSSGWVLRIPEDEDEVDLSQIGQSVVSYHKALSAGGLNS